MTETVNRTCALTKTVCVVKDRIPDNPVLVGSTSNKLRQSNGLDHKSGLSAIFITPYRPLWSYLVYLVRHSDLGPVFHRFIDRPIARFLHPTPIPPYFFLEGGGFPLDQIAYVGVSPSIYLQFS